MIIPEPRKLKSGNYFIQLRLNGVSVPITDSSATGCKRRAELIKAEYRSGKRAFSRSSRVVTLNDAIENYVDSRRNVLSPATIRGYEIIRRNRFQEHKDKRLSAINWQKAINSESMKCGPKTLKNAWGLIASVLRHYDLPVPHVKLPSLVKVETDWLEPEQIPPFVDAVKEKSFAIPALLALHGLRRSEIFALDWPAVNLKKNTITIKGAVVPDENHKFVWKKTAKNTTSQRTIPIMIPELADLLTAAQAEGKKIATGSPNSLCKQINRLCETQDLPQIGVHGLRHSFASLGYHLGISEREMMEWGGWADITTMHKIYTHIAKADLLKSENKMTSFFKYHRNLT